LTLYQLIRQKSGILQEIKKKMTLTGAQRTAQPRHWPEPKHDLPRTTPNTRRGLWLQPNPHGLCTGSFEGSRGCERAGVVSDGVLCAARILRSYVNRLEGSVLRLAPGPRGLTEVQARIRLWPAARANPVPGLCSLRQGLLFKRTACLHADPALLTRRTLIASSVWPFYRVLEDSMGCANNAQESATPEEAVVFVVQNHRDRSQAVGQTRLPKRLQQGL